MTTSRSGDAARTYVVGQAQRRRARLVAVHGWDLAPQQAAYAVLQSDRERSAEDRAREAEVRRWLLPWRLAYPEVRLEVVSRMWDATALLMEQARRAQLVVVGRRGATGFPGLILGSTAFDLLPNVDGALAVVPASSRPHPCRNASPAVGHVEHEP